MTLTEIKNFNNFFVNFTENFIITVTFDLGSEEDQERFTNQFEELKKCMNFPATLDISSDCSEEEDSYWAIADIYINAEKISQEEVENFILKITQI